MKVRAIILGCGSSAGVPRVGGPDGAGDWGACDPSNPKNRRSRCSIILQRACDEKGWDADDFTTVLIDTSPDLRQQLLSARIGRLDAVFITHDHADQTHGIDDLRVVALMGRRRVPVYIDDETSPYLEQRFGYCFHDNPDTGYPAILDRKAMPPRGEAVLIDGPTGALPIVPFLQYHGAVNSLGFYVPTAASGHAALAYSSDTNDLPEESFALLEGCNVWIVDCLRYTPHVSHAHLETSLVWLDRVRAKRGVLTNLHIDLDYEVLKAETPEHVGPAFDGMVIEASIT